MLANKLNKGDTIGIVSPSSPVTEDLIPQLKQGIQVFKDMGFNVVLSKNIYSNTLRYSATIDEKVEDIHEMFSNNEVKAIICSQGGQNSNAILPYLNYDLIKENPKIIMGISDSTALLNAIYSKTGLVTYHQNDIIWGIGREIYEKEIADLKLRLLEGKTGDIEHFTQWKCLKEGKTEGVLVGGNLWTFTKLLKTPYCPDLSNCILFLEEFASETPIDEIDSKINLLKQHGVFDMIKGLWLGYYEKDNKDIKFEDVVLNNLSEYNFPIIKCDDFGHNCENVLIPIGSKVKFDATNCKIEIVEEFLK